MDAVFAVALLLGIFSGVAHSADRDQTSGDFEFIYHELHGLLLTVHNGTCYFSPVPDDQKNRMNDDSVWASVMAGVKDIINHPDWSKLSHSDINSMRTSYSDLLANYRCLDKDIFTLDYFSAIAQNLVFQCSFENNEAGGWCNMHQDSHDAFNWDRRRGPTPTDRTGPDNDHTYGNENGHYAYIQDFGHWNWAGLLTPPIDLHHRTTYCLKFYYHMYGTEIGVLNVHIAHRQDPFQWQIGDTVLSLSGNHGNQWKLATVEFNTDWTFEVLFEGVDNKIGDHGDIAIDDIFLYTGPCSANTAAVPVETTTTSPQTTKVVHTPFFQCSFENYEAGGWCNMHQDLSDSFNWDRWHGETPTMGTGPHSDHTYGNQFGHYAYTKDFGNNGWAALLTPPFDAHSATSYCLKFYYHMRGSHIGAFQVHIVHTLNPGERELGNAVFAKEYHQGDDWKEATVDFTAHGTFEVLFEGILQHYQREGDIAIDDISIYEGHCRDVLN